LVAEGRDGGVAGSMGWWVVAFAYNSALGYIINSAKRRRSNFLCGSQGGAGAGAGNGMRWNGGLTGWWGGGQKVRDMGQQVSVLDFVWSVGALVAIDQI